MAYAQPMAVRRENSTAGSIVSVAKLRHPTPDLQTMQGAYRRNVMNLERSAEEMSSGGSDIGEEIRKMNALSRQNSIQSSHHGDISVLRSTTMERVGSTRSSRPSTSHRSIVDVNGAARWGGYSPNGFVTSPVGSVSGHWSQASLSRRTSESTRYSRLNRVSGSQDGQPQDFDFGFNRASYAAPIESTSVEQSRAPSQSSFAKRYDEIAGEIEESLQHIPPSPTKRAASLDREQEDEGGRREGTITPPDRPRSSDTYREAQLAFQDFDGVHFNPDTDEFVETDEHGNEVRRVSARSSTGGLSLEAAALLNTPRARPPSHVIHPPEEGMVYYPAPVPKMLNLPKRLSQLPAANVQSKRRSQMLNELDSDARASAPWLSPENVEVGDVDADGYYNRASVMADIFPGDRRSKAMSANLSNLPPHVRARMFFEHQPVRHDVELKRGSAVATLDSILEASASAPANAFTDHPYAGDVRKSVYAAEHKSRKSAGSNSVGSSPKDAKKQKHRSSSISGFFKRTGSSDETTDVLKRASRVSTMPDLEHSEGSKKLRKSGSRMSLGAELERSRDSARISLGANSEPGLESGLIASAQDAEYLDDEEEERPRPMARRSTIQLDDGQQIENDFKEEDQQEDLDEDNADTLFVKPSTLLAELQVRKAQQKSRGKTAATAFPQGMHSTLLQLDAVEEIAKRKRKLQRIDLAWEDPHQRMLQPDTDKEDEDVPLGMLFPGKDGQSHRRGGDGKDFDRPFGLIEKRQMEENEPLSNRRNRLRGGKPSNLNETGGAAADEGEHEEDPEGETLAQRLKRMKAKDETPALDDPAEKEEKRESGFADEVLGLAGLATGEKEGDVKADLPPPKPTPSPALDPDETLGQRRARLQREREASGGKQTAAGATRPPLQISGSLATLLTLNHVGQRQEAKKYEPSQGTLLHASSTMDMNQRNQLQHTNLNASSAHLDRPLVDARPKFQHAPSGLLANEVSRSATGGFAAGTYNNGMGGIQMQPSPATAMYGMNGAAPYFTSPTAMPYAGYGYGTAMGMYPQMQMQMQQAAYQQQMMNPATYNALTGGAMMSPPAMGGAFMGNAYNPGMMGGTYASYAQNMGTAGMPMGMGDEQITNSQKAAIDRWRSGVTYQ